MKKINMEKTYIRTDGWRGYEQPIYAVAGANDTGAWEDSPCPTRVADAELKMVKDSLVAAGIKYKECVCETTNVFCVHRYIVVAPEDHAAAYDIAEALSRQSGMRLLYSCEIAKSDS